MNNNSASGIPEIVGAAVLSLVLLACVARPFSPAGRYVADSRIGQAGDFYYEVSKGKVMFVTEQGRYVKRETYARTPKGWLWTIDRRKGPPLVYTVRCSWWQLSFYDQSGQKVGSMRRRFFPGLRPDWFQDCFPDWVQ